MNEFLENIFFFLKPPQPVEWNNVLDAFEHGNSCVQPKEFLSNPVPLSEDCLTLNVYVPGKIVIFFFFIIAEKQFLIR